MRRGEPVRESSNGWTAGEALSGPRSAPPSLPAAAAANGRASSENTATGKTAARRRIPLNVSKPKKAKSSFCRRFYVRWIQKTSNVYSLVGALFLWYSLGVVSISSSKLLLMKESSHSFTRLIGNVPPLFLTLQQQAIGCGLLRTLLHLRAFGSAGLQAWPSPPSVKSRLNHRNATTSMTRFQSPQANLFMAGLYFCLGFLFTNICFQGSSAAFVETIKAAEPITSAVIAVMWGIEIMGPPEMVSLGCIVAGCLLSTIGRSGEGGMSPSFLESLKSCCIVMIGNLCFSFRGLHQKLFQASPDGTVVDDMNLQFRMQQIGVLVLCIPVLIWDVPGILSRILTLSRTEGLLRSGIVFRYFQLAVVNGLAFASYNLASTYILTRISVVHHAALNCIRRIFAVVITSIVFGIPITWTGILGTAVSFGGFVAYTHYKQQRQSRPRPLSSLLPVSSSEMADSNHNLS